MLEEILRHINNWFPIKGKAVNGEFCVSDGKLELPFLVDMQYYRIIGSVFNDGLHQYGMLDLQDETFVGRIIPLAIPKAFLELADEITVWQGKNAEPTVYQTESFGGYSYTKASNADGSEKTWKDAFAGRLNAWRKL